MVNITKSSDLKIKLNEKLSELRSSFNEVNKAIEWGMLEDTYPAASQVFRDIEELEKIINSMK